MPGWESPLLGFGLGRRTLVMGVLNATPDSFSDGGLYSTTNTAVTHALQMARDGADIIDIGGESTRPATFSDNSPLDPDEEKRRVLPVIRALAEAAPHVSISIDTYKAEVAKAALDAGATMLNDISGLTFDPRMASLAAERRVSLVLMHLLGQPRAIPKTPVYHDVIQDINRFFQRQINIAAERGVLREQIILDPGIGFGKTAAHNLEILRRLRELTAEGLPLLVGPSRKGFIGKLLDDAPPTNRIEGTSAAVAIAIANGADIVRVHDVRAIARVCRVADAICRPEA